MLGADLAGEVSTDAALHRGSRRRATVHRRRARPRHQDQHAADVRRARHPSARAASSATLRRRSPSCEPDGVFLSNGPGDPATADTSVALTREVLGAGSRCSASASATRSSAARWAGRTYKMRFGHRGINIPVIEHAHRPRRDHRAEPRVRAGGRGGGAVRHPVRPRRGQPHLRQRRCVEGVRLLDGRAFSVQYHPEAAAGPHDAAYLFDRFVDLMAGDVPPPRACGVGLMACRPQTRTLGSGGK